jgi:hypothetical protein
VFVGKDEMVRKDFEMEIARVYLAICMSPSLLVWWLVRRFVEIKDAGGVAKRLVLVAGKKQPATCVGVA